LLTQNALENICKLRFMDKQIGALTSLREIAL
jgi:hypothetical protein